MIHLKKKWDFLVKQGLTKLNNINIKRRNNHKIITMSTKIGTIYGERYLSKQIQGFWIYWILTKNFKSIILINST